MVDTCPLYGQLSGFLSSFLPISLWQRGVLFCQQILSQGESLPELWLNTAWYLYKMVAQHMLRVHDVNKVFSERNLIWRLFRWNQVPSTNRTHWFTPHPNHSEVSLWIDHRIKKIYNCSTNIERGKVGGYAPFRSDPDQIFFLRVGSGSGQSHPEFQKCARSDSDSTSFPSLYGDKLLYSNNIANNLTSLTIMAITKMFRERVCKGNFY